MGGQAQPIVAGLIALNQKTSCFPPPIKVHYHFLRKKASNQSKTAWTLSYSTRLHEWIYLGIHIPSRSDTSQYGDICALLKNSPSRLRGRLESRVIFSTHRIDKILAQSQLKYKASLNTRTTF